MPDQIQPGSRAIARYLDAGYLCVDWLWDGTDFALCEFETGGGFSELAEPDRSRVPDAFFPETDAINPAAAATRA